MGWQALQVADAWEDPARTAAADGAETQGDGLRHYYEPRAAGLGL